MNTEQYLCINTYNIVYIKLTYFTVIYSLCLIFKGTLIMRYFIIDMFAVSPKDAKIAV